MTTFCIFLPRCQVPCLTQQHPPNWWVCSPFFLPGQWQRNDTMLIVEVTPGRRGWPWSLGRDHEPCVHNSALDAEVWGYQPTTALWNSPLAIQMLVFQKHKNQNSSSSSLLEEKELSLWPWSAQILLCPSSIQQLKGLDGFPLKFSLALKLPAPIENWPIFFFQRRQRPTDPWKGVQHHSASENCKSKPQLSPHTC